MSIRPYNNALKTYENLNKYYKNDCSSQRAQLVRGGEDGI